VRVPGVRMSVSDGMKVPVLRWLGSGRGWHLAVGAHGQGPASPQQARCVRAGRMLPSCPLCCRQVVQSRRSWAVGRRQVCSCRQE